VGARRPEVAFAGRNWRRARPPALPAQAKQSGVGSIAVALLWMKLFPELREVERLE
jgi:hypothetical protein